MQLILIELQFKLQLKLTHVWPDDEWLIAPRYQIFCTSFLIDKPVGGVICPLSIFFIGRKSGSHLGPLRTAGVVTLLIPVDLQSLESDVQCSLRDAILMLLTDVTVAS